MQGERLKRKDAIRGLRRCRCEHIYDSELSAPMFAVAFDMSDKTAVPELARKAIWLVSNTAACVLKGEEGAHIKNVAGLSLIMSKQRGAEKTVIVRQDANGEMQPVKEVDIQLRIHEVRGDNNAIEHYTVLLVSSPIAFSLRKAVSKTLQTKGRGPDGQDAETRRSWWNTLATHVRQMSAETAAHSHSIMAGLYTQAELAMSYDPAVDWFSVSNSQSFTSMFNVHRTVDWIANHFFTKHKDANSLVAEGFGFRDRGGECMTPAFIDRCIRYDGDVQAGINNTYRKKKKKANEDDNEEEEENSILAPPPYQGESSDESDQLPPPGYPACSICMTVHMTTNIECFPSYSAFWANVKGFPTSVTLEILKTTLQLDVGENSGEDDELLTLLESNTLLRGDEAVLKRLMLSGGDAFWGAQCLRSVLAIENEEERLEHMKKIMRLFLALGLTRAAGSDVYENKRVDGYAKFMASATESNKECADAFAMLVGKVVTIRQACPIHESMLFFMHVMYECNDLAWRLRPDNLFLVIQLMVSDAMLCLNYHDSVIGGAENGIGSTVVVRDGAGSYRTNHKEPGETNAQVKQVCDKNNGCGCDMCVGIHKAYTSMRKYSQRCADAEMDSCFSELKRTTELGLLQECCNVIEHGSNDVLKQTHTVKDTCSRRYSTELKAGNDLQSQSCMQAVSWLVVRNTLGLDLNRFASTKEDEKNKGRMAIEYRQVIYGYWCICSNFVGYMSRERFKTLLTVCRSIASAADATDSNSIADMCVTSVNEAKKERAKVVARPLYFANMCTVITSGFIQWTGMLGKLPTSPCLEAILEVFYGQMASSKFMINPDMYTPGERGRCIQISKARGVAMSLILTSMEQTLEAGRRQKGQQEAIECTTLRLMMESTTPHIAAWIMADTLEHMFRTDFVILMQLLGQKLGVPADIEIEQVLTWLKTGVAEGSLQAWLEQQQRVVATMHDKRVGSAEINDCFYLTHNDLMVNLAVPGSISDNVVSQTIGNVLFSQNWKLLQESCQIQGNRHGAEIVQCMLMTNSNIEMEWPSVFGDSQTLEHFWLNGQQRPTTKLMPIRMIMMDPKKANVCVDMRWLLLYCSLCGPVPSQSSRFLGVGRWIEYFYHTCVPDRMVCSPWLFTGMPSPAMNSGMLMVPFRPSGRKMLRRQQHMMQSVGLDAPIRSRVIEDMGPAALRYQLAAMLKVSERTLPTDSVSYSFPVAMWCPVRIAEGEFASLKWNSDVGFVMQVPGSMEAVAPPGNYLGGRIGLDVRPLCMFDRSGVLVFLPSNELGLLREYDANRAAYRVTAASGAEVP